MATYLFRRLGFILLTMLLASIVIFAATQFLPGDVAQELGEQLVRLAPVAAGGDEVGGELGRGGWGVVLGARHRTLDRPVAIKQLPRGFAADPGVRARFVAEAKVLAALSHPHIVPVYDYVENETMCLLVMEALPGGTVWSRFVEQGFAAETSCVAVLATLAGLATHWIIVGAVVLLGIGILGGVSRTRQKDPVD